MTAEARPGVGTSEATPDEQIEIVRQQMLIEHEEAIAGHEEYGVRNDKWALIYSGLLRGNYLERVTRGFLYAERNQSSEGRVVVDDLASPHSDECFSLIDFSHSYRIARERHNAKFADKRTTEAIIPPIDSSQALDFMRDQFKGGLLHLVKDGKMMLVKDGKMMLVKDGKTQIVKDEVDQLKKDKVAALIKQYLEIDLDNTELKNEKVFRYPPSQFERRPSEVRDEKNRLKHSSVELVLTEAREGFENTGDRAKLLFNASRVVDKYNKALEDSDYRDEVTMYFEEQSATAFLRELMWNGELEEVIVRREFDLDGETHVIDEERFYRQKPQEDTGE